MSAPSAPSSPPPYVPSRMTATGIATMLGFVLLESAVVLMVASSKTSEGKLPFNSASIILLSESCKLVVSLIALWSAGQTALRSDFASQKEESGGAAPAAVTGEEQGLGELRRLSLLGSLRYAVPGLLYTVNNNMYMAILTLMSPAYFQLLLNSRVVWTGFAFRWFMGRHLSQRQWIASVMLLFGCVLSQFGTQDEVSTEGGVSLTLTGLLLTSLYCAVSVSASVYNELLMKAEPSLHVANIQLYAFGVLFNAAGLMWQGRSQSQSFWMGWELPMTWTLCTLYVVIGLLISRIMKHFDSIMKIFCMSCSNLVVYTASIAMGTESFTAVFVASFAIVTWSGYRYSTIPPADLVSS